MGLLARLLNPIERRSALITGGSLQEPQGWLLDTFGGLPSASGMRVTPDTALSVVAVFAAVKLIATSLAALELVVNKQLSTGGHERDPSHPLYPLLHDEPNGWQSSMEFRQMMAGHQVLRGNAYAYIQSSGRKAVEALIPLDPRRMQPYRLLQPPQYLAGPIVYRYTPHAGEQIVFRQEEILHLRGFSSDGFTGLSPIQVHREAIGLAMAQEGAGANFMRNGMRPSGTLTHPGTLKDAARKNIRQSLEELHSGVGNAGRMLLLEEGLTWTQIGLSAEDSQYLESRKFTVEEIARMFQVPPHLLAELTRSTNNNIEEQGREFLTYTLMPWIVSWKQAIRRSLFTETWKATHDVEFISDVLLKGDFPTRMDGYSKGRTAGLYTINDMLRSEGLNTIGPEGDVRLVPVNMVNAETLLKAEDPAAPDPGATPQDPEGDPGTSPDAQPVENNALIPGVERSLALRLRLRGAHHRLFVDAAGRAVRRETKAIRAAMGKLMGKRDLKEFSDWLDTFYAEHRGVIAQGVAPICHSYGEAIHGALADELGERALALDDVAPLMRDYVASLAARHVERSKAQLRELVAQGPDGLVAALNRQLDDWDAKRPARIADREVVSAEGHLARAAIAAVGRGAVWRAGAGECAACQALDGRQVHGDQPFLSPGDRLHDAQGATLFTAQRIVRYAPLHPGCRCQVAPA